MSKPEVVGYASSEGLDAVRSESQAVFIYPTPVGFGEHASQALIRLADHEAAMAEVVELSGMRASSLANVSMERNELLGLLRECRGIIIEVCQTYGNPTPDATLERIDANLEHHKC